MTLLRIACAALLALPAARLAAAEPAAPKDRPNVLFIAVDDLKPKLGCYGDPWARTPCLDRLAARGLLFNRAYCQQAVCSPSRTSLLTGRRPDTTRVYDLETHFRKTIPDVVTLPEHFKKSGYHTQGIGKIYHGGLDDPQSWSVPHTTPKAPGFGPEGQALLRKLVAEAREAGKDTTKRQNQPRGLPWEAPDVPDNALIDGATADGAVEILRGIQDRPFFLAVGFLKPHLPFVAPKRYWDLYDPGAFTLSTTSAPPEGAPAYAGTGWGELRAYVGIPKTGPLSESQARSMLHGYHAAASYTDAQIGRLLDELERLGLRERTIVVVWGDHGWHLGDHGFWCKHTNYEQTTRSPLLVAAPGRAAAGKKTDALVEFVDVYPTLADLCGLPLPEGLEGTSFKALLDDPARTWKKGVISQYPRHIPGSGAGMGYALRTDRYRLVAWGAKGRDAREFELYDYQADPEETVNLAARPEHAARVRELTALLDAGWKALQPK